MLLLGILLLAVTAALGFMIFMKLSCPHCKHKRKHGHPKDPENVFFECPKCTK